MDGYIKNIRAFIYNNTLEVAAEIETEKWGPIFAHLPDREMAAIIPRSILAGSETVLDPPVLRVINRIVKRLVRGRKVRISFVKGKKVFLFLPWRDVRFIEGINPAAEMKTRSP